MTNANDELYSNRYFEPIGPNGELLLEYSIYDVMDSGFKRVVLIATKHIKDCIKHSIESRFTGKIEIRWVDSEPMSAFSFRKQIEHQYFNKNTYALWKAKSYLANPFLLVDANYYHGKRSFKRSICFLNTIKEDLGIINLCLGDTLSPYGYVNRSVCFTKNNGLELKNILELEKIRKKNGFINYSHTNIPRVSEEMPTVDMFCLNDRIFDAYKSLNETFKKTSEKPAKKITISNLINFLIERKMAKVRILTIHSNWFGIQFKPERVLAKNKINRMITRKLYPVDLGRNLQYI